MRVLPTIARFTLLATPLVVAGCPGSLENPERFIRSNQSAGDCKDVVPELLAKTCAVAGCHAADTPAQGLDLESANVASRLVGQPATGSGCSGTLADPSDPTGSLFYLKLTAKPPCGAQMPYLGKPISASQLACVAEWIAGLGGGNPPADAGGGLPRPDAGTGGPPQPHRDAGTVKPGPADSGTAGADSGSSVGSGPGLRGEYFDEENFTSSKLVRIDPNLDFFWGATESPDPKIAADGSYSARWTGFVTPEFGETYTFTARSDDGVTLSVDGQQLFADTTEHNPMDFSGTIALEAGVPVPIQVDWINANASGDIHLSWSSASQTKQIIPSSRLSPPK